jgi:hypothetical protein
MPRPNPAYTRWFHTATADRAAQARAAGKAERGSHKERSQVNFSEGIF